METAFCSQHPLRMVGGTIAFRNRRVPTHVAHWGRDPPATSVGARYEDVAIPKRRNWAPRRVHRRYKADRERRPLRAILATRATTLTCQRPQSSSASRFTASHAGFFILSQSWTPGAIGRVLPLRHDALEPHPTGVLEDGGSIIEVEMLAEPDACTSLGKHRRERRLAYLEGVTAQIVAAQFNQVEGVHEDGGIDPVVTQAVEPGNPSLVASNSLAIEDAGA